MKANLSIDGLKESAKPNRLRKRGAFTMIEVLVSFTMLGLIAAGTMWALTQSNAYASANRVHTCARTLVQNQIDAIETAESFDPQLGYVPTVLATGTSTQSNLTIYKDPLTNAVAATGTLTTTVADLGLTQTTNSVTSNLNVRRATVTLTYTYRNQSYAFTMCTLRSSDQ
jgi:type II secretory pathway pseudopilin PulG